MSAAQRALYVGLRAPILFDRPGLRWLLSDRLWPVPVMVLRHRGRRSGRLYSTPVEAIAEDRERGEVAISPMRGEQSDWYRNVVAGGLDEVRIRGQGFGAAWAPMSEQENRDALAGYLDAHPRYGRLVVRTLMRMHGLEGDPLEALPERLPMLRLTLRPRAEHPVSS
jgi:deazaflavin-dependent oxidoreductase (nitroreductase family)